MLLISHKRLLLLFSHLPLLTMAIVTTLSSGAMAAAAAQADHNATVSSWMCGGEGRGKVGECAILIARPHQQRDILVEEEVTVGNVAEVGAGGVDDMLVTNGCGVRGSSGASNPAFAAAINRRYVCLPNINSRPNCGTYNRAC